MKAIATFAAACTLALAFAAPAAAAPVDGFDFRQIGTDGNNCQLVISTYSNAPVTRWDRKRGQVFKLKVHPGGHTWGRPEDHEEALRWLDEQWEALAARRRAAVKP